MSGSTLLYAWTVPAFSSGSPVDHTWVTTYDNRVNPYPNDAAVVAAQQNYWYCWGSFHPTGGTPAFPDGFIGSQGGNLALAQCLVQPNADSRTVPAARGTIFTYGVDGVCHQLANQVLYATGTTSTPQLTVQKARGYMASTFIYGTFGLQHAAWANKIAACSGVRLTPSGVATMAGGAGGPSGPDDFEARAKEVLGPDNTKLHDLLRLRAGVHQFAAQAWPGTGQPSAEALNARNQDLINEAARLLRPDEFSKIFGFSPGEKIDLVDKEIGESAGRILPPNAR
jgi:hypothetical protein